MVTRETRYIGQLYFGLSTDDPANVAEWHNGDHILLMDKDKMFVYDEAAVTFHEIPMGGGGGGGGYTANDWLDFTKPTGVVESSAAITNQWPPVFKNHTGISGLSIPNATELPADFCRNATSLSEVYAPQVAKLNGFCFNTTAIEYAVFQAMRNVYGGQDFAGCANLLGADFGGTFVSGDRGIATFTFSNSAKMAVLVLRSSATWALQNINAFQNTPFASGKDGGTLYVPQALISSYQSATNWSTILGYTNNRIQAIEGSIYETKYVDGTSIS